MALPTDFGGHGNIDPFPPDNKMDGLHCDCPMPAEQDMMAIGSNHDPAPSTYKHQHVLGANRPD